MVSIVQALMVCLAMAAPSFARLQHPKVSLVTSGSWMTKAILENKIKKITEDNPYFSKEECSKMFDTKKRLGGSVPPAEYVEGCPEVCDFIREMKEYWKSGDTASFACEHAADFGCVYDGTPPVTAADIGC
eukprot:gnl/MRDRNA2_/MRDRNA2_87491_c0_seq1.p1 gnl/MRDRNA2_/MRDRNA2_87491_c0~~gnl/MRDRNA2_/MRDRNA2_87491_c0_seq1.p1  ORF type:complete len:131 (-),score=29.05 gnl/MRDRNA2_/MRDRNA2_87491_c0_seq1:8-400(-)